MKNLNFILPMRKSYFHTQYSYEHNRLYLGLEFKRGTMTRDLNSGIVKTRIIEFLLLGIILNCLRSSKKMGQEETSPKDALQITELPKILSTCHHSIVPEINRTTQENKETESS